MALVHKERVGQLKPGECFLEGNGRQWVKVGWDSVATHGPVQAHLLKLADMHPVCDMGGNVMFAPGSLVVTAIRGESVDCSVALEYWQYAVN
jgi:hypothetical protein